MQVRKSVKEDFIYLLCLIIFGIFITYSNIDIPGVSSDSISYLSAAENLIDGNGLIVDVVFLGHHSEWTYFSSWPPLFPIIIAITSLITGQSVINSAQILTSITFVAGLVPIYFIGKAIFDHKSLSFLTALLVMLSKPLISVRVWIWSEIFFIFLSVSSVLFLVRYYHNHRKGDLWVTAIFLSLALITRYTGVVLFITLFIVLLIIRLPKKEYGQLSREAFPLMIASIPLILWLIRNYSLTGFVTGRSQIASAQGLITNTKRFIITFLDSLFSPLTDFPYLPFSLLVIVSLITLLLLLIIIIKQRKLFLEYLNLDRIFYFEVLGIYITVYSLFLVILGSIAKFDPINLRLIAPIMPFLILVIGLVLDLIISCSNRVVSIFVYSLILLLMILNYYSAINILLDFKDGAGYRFSILDESPTIASLGEIWEENDVVYSHDGQLLNFYYDRPTRTTYWSDVSCNDMYKPNDNGKMIFVFLDQRIGASQVRVDLIDQLSSNCGDILYDLIYSDGRIIALTQE